MNTFAGPLPPDLARAGRALTEVSAAVIGEESGIEIGTIEEFERGVAPLSLEQNARLRTALEDHGAVFFGDDSKGGYGVRRKHSVLKAQQLERWESEGGPVSEQDI